MISTTRPRRQHLLLPLALLLTTLLAATGAAPNPPADLAGVWLLDPERSEDLQTPLSAALTQLREAGPQGGGPGIDGSAGDRTQRRGTEARRAPGPRGGTDVAEPARRPGQRIADPGAAPDGGPSAGPGRGGLRTLVRDLDRLMISHDGPRVEIVDGSDRTRIWAPDGAETVQRSRGGRELREHAWWDGEVLVLVSEGDRFKLQQRLQRPDADTLVLDVSLTISDSAEPVQAKLVYRKP